MTEAAQQINLFQPNKLEQRFGAFHTENPNVYSLFKRFTFEVIRRGHQHYSADAVIHRIRWETGVVTQGDDFKINNNWVSAYVRLFERDHPQHAGFFRKRVSQYD